MISSRLNAMLGTALVGTSLAHAQDSTFDLQVSMGGKDYTISKLQNVGNVKAFSDYVGMFSNENGAFKYAEWRPTTGMQKWDLPAGFLPKDFNGKGEIYGKGNVFDPFWGKETQQVAVYSVTGGIRGLATLPVAQENYELESTDELGNVYGFVHSTGGWRQVRWSSGGTQVEPLELGLRYWGGHKDGSFLTNKTTGPWDPTIWFANGTQSLKLPAPTVYGYDNDGRWIGEKLVLHHGNATRNLYSLLPSTNGGHSGNSYLTLSGNGFIYGFKPQIASDPRLLENRAFLLSPTGSITDPYIVKEFVAPTKPHPYLTDVGTRIWDVSVDGSTIIYGRDYSSVPEPATWVALAFGTLALTRRRRRVA
ncbi:PEP-CTERM sorting domain-containing protein [bacterium]|nr:MAG: PEP-CTERM sorting domain-containing protein [bacterium]